jgi:hypothetical protein
VTKQLREPERELEAATRRSDVDPAAKELQRVKVRFAIGTMDGSPPGEQRELRRMHGHWLRSVLAYHQALVGGALGHLGRPCDALAELGRAVAQARDSDARYWDAELHRSQER